MGRTKKYITNEDRKLAKLEADRLYREANAINIKERHKTHRLLNKATINKRNKKWKEENPDKYKASIYRYNKENPHIISWRNLLNRVLLAFGLPKEGHTVDLLGYSATDLKYHIESLFTDGMSWDNYGEWHIDHIKRVSEFDSKSSPSIVNSLSNLRPLWATTREINGVMYEGNLNRG